MDPSASLMRYLATLLQVEMTDPEPYLFDRECLVLPKYLKETLPDQIVQAFVNARWAASKALRYIRIVERNYYKRFNAMCPLRCPKQAFAHVDSVTRLMAWKSDRFYINPTLAPTPKIDPSMLEFHVDQRTYDEFVANYVKALEQFMNEPYQEWLLAKEEVDFLIANSRLDELDRSHWHRFWDLTFLVEMNKWEGRLQGLVLPSWEGMMDNLRRLILELVESPQVALSNLHVGSGILTQ